MRLSGQPPRPVLAGREVTTGLSGTFGMGDSEVFGTSLLSKRQFSRDIGLAGGYLMASRHGRLYTASDAQGILRCVRSHNKQ